MRFHPTTDRAGNFLCPGTPVAHFKSGRYRTPNWTGTVVSMGLGWARVRRADGKTLTTKPTHLERIAA
jgi:hypothetical protein